MDFDAKFLHVAFFSFVIVLIKMNSNIYIEYSLCFSVGLNFNSSNSSCKRSAGTMLHLAFARHAYNASLQV